LGLSIKEGILAGDFAATINVRGHAIGIIGLNSTFLQLASGDYQGRLVWDARQVQAVCGDIADWTANHDARLLVTHQGPSWLTETAQADYPEINPAGRFAAHLFGHVHRNELVELTEAGGGGVRKWQVASSSDRMGLQSVVGREPEKKMLTAGDLSQITSAES
jgi:hypothetical protein